MNVIQAEKNAAKFVGDANADKEQRAVSLCWLLHLVGDSHQPLHSSALFTTHRFRDGDHGGNFLAPDYAYKTFQGGYTLHAFWDDAISTDEPYATCRVLAYDLEQNKELAAAGEKATAKLDVGDWIDESHELCKMYVYTPEVKQQIAAREGHSHLGPLDLPPGYTTNAENRGGAAQPLKQAAGWRRRFSNCCSSCVARSGEPFGVPLSVDPVEATM